MYEKKTFGSSCTHPHPTIRAPGSHSNYRSDLPFFGRPEKLCILCSWFFFSKVAKLHVLFHDLPRRILRVKLGSWLELCHREEAEVSQLKPHEADGEWTSLTTKEENEVKQRNAKEMQIERIRTASFGWDMQNIANDSKTLRICSTICLSRKSDSTATAAANASAERSSGEVTWCSWHHFDKAFVYLLNLSCRSHSGKPCWKFCCAASLASSLLLSTACTLGAMPKVMWGCTFAQSAAIRGSSSAGAAAIRLSFARGWASFQSLSSMVLLGSLEILPIHSVFVFSCSLFSPLTLLVFAFPNGDLACFGRYETNSTKSVIFSIGVY